MAGIVERARALHEDVEVLEKACAEELAQRAAMTKRTEQIMSDHTTHALVRAIRDRSAQLDRLYGDEDGLLRSEVDEMTGEGSFEIFSARLDALRHAHRVNRAEASLTSDPAQEMVQSVLEAEPEVIFTAEEGGGRYLDLHACHARFVNLKGVKPVDYYTYVTAHACAPDRVSVRVASTAQYRRYLDAIVEYLLGFVRRTRPLLDTEAIEQETRAAVRAAWERGDIGRWQHAAGAQQPGAPAAAPGAEPAAAAAASPNGTAAAGGTRPHDPSAPAVDLSAFADAEQLERELHPDSLKAELQRRGLKCGGRPSERAARLFLCCNTPLSQLDKKHFAKAPPAPPPGGAGAEGGAAGAPPPRRPHDGSAHRLRTAEQEALLLRLGSLLDETIGETGAHVEKQQARTYDEIEAEILAAEAEEAGEAAERDDDDDDDDDVAPIYNPKNLPIGWDGKPIPYWLYKLHGLNLEFKCEICGNVSYWGPREYERHFAEYRHAHGMRCLGIPNSKEFHGVTMIDDAYALHAKLQQDRAGRAWNAEMDEEYEDSAGNVMPRKTYEDLARQGLL